MPELAEVEFNRRQWNAGLHARVQSVELHATSRIARRLKPAEVKQALQGARFLSSEAFGKRMLFRFSKGGWLGIHLGMTGRLHAEAVDFRPGRHDHLVLRQRARSLVLTDSRQFGLVEFHHGSEAPAWWRNFPPAVTSSAFTVAHLSEFLRRHRRLPLKAVLLLQSGFPGIGNWMADEVLWQARLPPSLVAGRINLGQTRALWRAVRRVSTGALRTVGENYSDPPSRWLFHQRWTRRGKCPRDGSLLRFDEHGGRTTAWCPHCQRARKTERAGTS